MSVRILLCANPFYIMKAVTDEAEYHIGPRSICINLSREPLLVKGMPLASMQSAVLVNVTVHRVASALVVEGFDAVAPERAMFTARTVWP